MDYAVSFVFPLVGAEVTHLPQFAASEQLGQGLSGLHITFSVSPKKLTLISFCLVLY